MRRTLLLFAAALVLVIATPTAHAQSLSVLHTFTGTPDGATPVGNLVQLPNGNLVGVTSSGGAYNQGTIYTIAPDGSGYSILYSFLAQWDPPAGPVVVSDGAGSYAIYGTVSQGGMYENGAIWKMDSSGNFSDIHDLTDNDGNGPGTNLLLATDGNLWGNSGTGGIDGEGPVGYGNVFKVSPSGEFSVVHTFSVADGILGFYGTLFEASDGNIYGTAETGGANGYTGGDTGDGTAYQLTLAGGFKVLWNFTGGNDGCAPFGSFSEAPAGVLWSSASSCGTTGVGTLFKMTPQGVLTPTYEFAITDGSSPVGQLALTGDGVLAGLTFFGGVSGNDNNFGTIFAFSPTSPATFVESLSFNNSGDGAHPLGNVLQGQDGNIYTTTSAGLNNHGNLLKIALDPPLPSILSMKLSSTLIDVGGSTTLTWALASSYGYAFGTCVATGNDTAEWTGKQSSSGTLTLKPTASGTYTYGLICAGTLTAQVTLTVKQATTTTVASTVGSPVTQGTPVTLTATVSGSNGTQRPTGSVTFSITYDVTTTVLGTVELNGSQQAVYIGNTSALQDGTYTVTAAYSGDATFSASQQTLSFYIKIKSSTAVTYSPDPPVSNSRINVYAKVTGYIPTGTVTFSLGGSGAMAQSPLVNGTAIYTAELSSSLCGTYAITANYSGDSNNAGSTGSANATFMSTSTTTLVATPVKVVQGNSVVLTATVSSPCTAPAPTGSVSFSVNGVIEGSADLEGTTAQISVPTSTDNAPGAYTVDATYAGDASHSGSSGSAVVTVVQ